VNVLLDTSYFIAHESGRPIGPVPNDALAAVSVVTLAELRIGVLVADDEAREARLATYEWLLEFEPISIDVGIAEAFASLVRAAKRSGRKPRLHDTWIAATAVCRNATLVTQDRDFEQFPGLRVLLV
jgi:predicted nucleic acid-binding protein